MRDRIGHTLSRLQEGITGVRVIQAFGREDVEIDRFQRGNRRLYDAHMRSVRAQAWYLPVIELAGLGTTAVVVGIGGWLAIDGAVTVGTVAFFVLTLCNLFEPIQQLSQLFNTVQSAGAALNKMLERVNIKKIAACCRPPPTSGRRERAGSARLSWQETFDFARAGQTFQLPSLTL